MPVFITKKPIDILPVDASVCPVSYEAGLDDAHGVHGSVVLNHSKPGDVIVVPPLGLEQQHVLYVNADGIENDSVQLARSYREILKMAGEYHFHSIAIPMFPANESTSLSPGQVYRIVRQELKNRPADEDLAIYLVLKWRQKLPASRQLIMDVRSYLRDVQKERHSYLLSFLDDDSRNGERFLLRQKRISADTSMPAAQELPEEGSEDAQTPSNFTDQHDPASLISESEDIANYGISLETSCVPDENVCFSMRIDSDDTLEPSEAANFPIDYEKRDDPFFDPAHDLFTLEEGFAETVLKMIDERGLTDPQCYSRANLSRAVFNKLKQSALTPDKSVYSPSKSTALALTVALKLSLEEANELLKKAGFAISHSNKRDIVVEYFLVHQIYDIYALNEVLFRFDLPLLGSA